MNIVSTSSLVGGNQLSVTGHHDGILLALWWHHADAMLAAIIWVSAHNKLPVVGLT